MDAWSMVRTNLTLLVVTAGLGLFVLTQTPVVQAATVVTVTVMDGDEVGIEGAAVKWADGSWHNAGTTDASGQLVVNITNDNYSKIRVTYHQGSQDKTRAQVEAAGNAPEWQTETVRFELRNHAMALIQETPGGNLRQGGGFWDNHGNTGTDGYVDVELFPRSSAYKFRMGYNYSSQTIYPVVSEGGANTFAFQTGRLTLNYSGSIRFAGGSWRTFDKPSMEFLPWTTRFRFDGCQTYITIEAGDDLTKGVIFAQLKDYRGRGLAGGVARYAPGGSWFTLGTTPSSGKLCLADEDLAGGNVKVRMTYNQGSQDQTHSVNDPYVFQTTTATVKLVDHAGNGLAGGTVAQGGSYWETHGTTNSNGEVKIQMFPGSYKFRMTKNNTSQTYNSANIASPVVFQTGSLDPLTGCTQAALSGSWVGVTQGMELLPGSYEFRSPTTWNTVTAGTTNAIACQ